MEETETEVTFDFKHVIALDKAFVREPSKVHDYAAEAAKQMREAVTVRLCKYILTGN